MGIITVKIRDDVEKKLRKLALSRYGGVKGSLSRVIEEGIMKLEVEYKESKRIFKVMKGNKILFASRDLDEVAKFLRENNLTTRDILIIS